MFFKFILQYKNTHVINHTDQEGIVESVDTKGLHIGIDFIKGFFLTLFLGSFFIPISKDGMSYIIRKKYSWSPSLILYFIYLRTIAILDSVFYLLFVPFTLVFYIVCFIASLLFLLLAPFTLCFDGLTGKVKSAYIIGLGSFLSILIIIVIVVLIPIHVILPELTIYVFKLNRLGDPLEYCD